MEEATMPRILGRLLATAAAVLLVTCSNEGPSTTVASVTVTPPAPTVVVAGKGQPTPPTPDANRGALTARAAVFGRRIPAPSTPSPARLVPAVGHGAAAR